VRRQAAALGDLGTGQALGQQGEHGEIDTY
jgi:hypothetical protein